MKISKIITFLLCPICKSEKLIISKKNINCQKCNHSYPIINDIPVMLPEFLDQQEQNQKKIFNDHYNKFSSKTYKLDNCRYSMLNRIFDHQFTKSINTYLDIGCGATGYTVIEAAKKNIPISFGCDISLEAMIKAKKLSKLQKVSNKTAFVVATAQNLPFKNNYFNYISAVSILEHLDNDQLTIKSIYKILAKKGHLFICVPNAYKKIPIFLWPFYYFTDKKIGHKRHYSLENLNSLLIPNNFKKISHIYNGHLIKFIQLFLDKIKINNTKLWWSLEKSDINNNQSGVQLNTIFQKN
jgi:ubiquinone/menaquinone biosynthesis C-methylase UbiE